MSGRPDPVTLDDLAEPRFSDEVRAVLDFMASAAAPPPLDPSALMQAASEQTGLDDFGDDAFVERLTVLCRALDEEAGLSPAGRFSQQVLITGLLKNRLLIEDRIARHPEILDERISEPVIICGLPRTGTTHLHNLMAADPRLRSLPYWESLEPVLPESERPGPGEQDPRRARTEQALWLVNEAMPYFKRMHEMTVDHVHEEIQLLAIDFSTMLFETIAPMPTWRDFYLSHDQTPSYEYLLRILKVLQWERGGRRWVLKSPQHLEQFPALRKVFPDAVCVVTHRDPVAVTASLTTMVGYGARMASEHIDPLAVGRYWGPRIERMLRSCADQREVLDPERSTDVRFPDFMADETGTVERIYSLAGMDLTAEARSAMEGFVAEHPRGRHGTVNYRLEPFGMDRHERREALRFYSDRFGLDAEEGAG